MSASRNFLKIFVTYTPISCPQPGCRLGCTPDVDHTAGYFEEAGLPGREDFGFLVSGMHLVF
jgi:hypothetical protein